VRLLFLLKYYVSTSCIRSKHLSPENYPSVYACVVPALQIRAAPCWNYDEVKLERFRQADHERCDVRTDVDVNECWNEMSGQCVESC
jgi:hypothetical protein